jgi:gliding motility-associated-like protein
LGFALNAQKVNLLPDTIGMCKGDSVMLDIKSNAIGKNASYQWTIPSKGIIQHTSSYLAKQPGLYSIKVLSGNNVFTDSCFVKFYPKPRLFLNDTVICNSSVAIIDTKNPTYKYLWSNDESGPRVRIEGAGRYWVKINNKGCSAIDTFNVSFYQSSVANFGNDITFCMSDENKSLSIKPSTNTKVTWSNGSTSFSITPTKAGWYWVKTENPKCGVRTDSVKVNLKACECEILIPNSFTPNEDGKNDYFFPVLQCDYSHFTLTITDRWDNVVFVGNSVNSKWDGRFKGNLCPDDIYVYEIEAQEKISGKKITKPGKVSLFR